MAQILLMGPITLRGRNLSFSFTYQLVKGTAVPVTDREGPQGCETSKLPHFL
jgi:hypothetical protein